MNSPDDANGNPIGDDFPLDAAALARASDHGRRAAAALGLDRMEGERLRLVVEELVANLMDHGQVPPEGRVLLSTGRDGDASWRLVVDDPGVAFDPRSDLPWDSRNAGLDDRPIGSLGWPLILEYCRIESYERTDDGRNRTVLAARA